MMLASVGGSETFVNNDNCGPARLITNYSYIFIVVYPISGVRMKITFKTIIVGNTGFQGFWYAAVGDIIAGDNTLICDVMPSTHKSHYIQLIKVILYYHQLGGALYTTACHKFYLLPTAISVTLAITATSRRVW